MSGKQMSDSPRIGTVLFVAVLLFFVGVPLLMMDGENIRAWSALGGALLMSSGYLIGTVVGR